MARSGTLKDRQEIKGIIPKIPIDQRERYLLESI